jgi:hypothetical protein
MYRQLQRSLRDDILNLASSIQHHFLLPTSYFLLSTSHFQRSTITGHPYGTYIIVVCIIDPALPYRASLRSSLRDFTDHGSRLLCEAESIHIRSFAPG